MRSKLWPHSAPNLNLDERPEAVGRISGVSAGNPTHRRVVIAAGSVPL